jgi:hypothetical protein
MDELMRSCADARDYPRNLVCHNTYQHVLSSYLQGLNAREQSLFCSENKAAVDFWEIDDGG